ncbi:MAG TPA: ABC transporter ATP-binding protein [Solirubrobacteraceae bacterium]|nr:ABC transporter ATP-binding protein [Solirubrobacteraceae bacterium]
MAHPGAATDLMSPPTLRASSLGKRFGDRVALRDVSFELAGGEILAVIGPNGAGKTTLLSLLAGASTPSEGSVSAPAGERIGWVPQQTAVYSKLSVLENLRLFARLERVGDPDGAVETMLEQTGLRERADEQLGRLSGGNRQRVNIAVGLLADPAVALLDEPSASLDPRQRERLWEFIGVRARAGTSIVFATHNIAEAERYAGRVLVLADGELLYGGTLEGLRGDRGHDLESAFVEFLRERGH